VDEVPGKKRVLCNEAACLNGVEENTAFQATVRNREQKEQRAKMNLPNREEALENFRATVAEAKEYILSEAWKNETPKDLVHSVEERKNELTTAIYYVRRLKAVCEEELQEAALVDKVYDFVARNDDFAAQGDSFSFVSDSIARSLQLLGHSVMELLLDDFTLDEELSSIFELPYVLSRACRSQHPVKKKPRYYYEDADPPRCLWKVAYTYVLCRLAVDDLQRMPFSFSLQEWERKVKSLMDKPLQTSRAAASGTTLFLLDWCIELIHNKAPLPEGLTLNSVLNKLVAKNHE
jgi:hypothetical protein